MKGMVIIGKTDISNYVVDDTYKVDESDTYESWEDGNMVEHRVIVSKKVSGSFDVVLCEKNGMTLPQFKAVMDAADDNGVITVLAYLTNAGEKRAVEAYYQLTSKQHTLLPGGKFLDVVTVEINER